MQTWHELVPYWVLSELIASAACLTALTFFHHSSTQFVRAASAVLIICALLAALPCAFRAWRIRLSDTRRSSFKVEQPVVCREGETITMTFVPPDHHAYLIGLRSSHRTRLFRSTNLMEVDCPVETEGETVMEASFPPFNGEIGRGPDFYDLLGNLEASPDKTYRVELFVRHVANDLPLQQTRLAIIYDWSARESDRSMDGDLFAGVGECFLLMAYGVFVAGAIQLLSNRQDQRVTR